MSLNVEANKYSVTIDDAQVTDQGNGELLEVPAAVTVSYAEGALDTMVGLSPLDGKMVIHVDTNKEPLRAIYVNDQLVYGSDAGDFDPEWIKPFADALTDTGRPVR